MQNSHNVFGVNINMETISVIEGDEVRTIHSLREALSTWFENLYSVAAEKEIS